ncbi:hypothetical protein O7626_31410 [Micromonospora sp. WMMD1102]|uniref:hypothetical protein n=1 Tax=Micromonospora sp. WMMD1102 TaxID=3016105 RepID=UPI00241525E3|nr:hypothetical protein [Micromonospora sp. WMMD1102]MDG4790377.1 hypothetical protein [Micromonospora sp. WMMD1102]
MPSTTTQPTGDQNPPEQPPTGSAPDSTEQTELDRLRAENARLREQLAEVGQPVTSAVSSEPRFTFSEGQRDELERTGRTVSPFTGKRYVGTGVDDAREATAEEFNKAKPPERAKADTKTKPSGRSRKS